jgi:AcrR family transcriptional regulator
VTRTTQRGRPRSSSRDTLCDAAAELFLEQGFAATSVDDIARRAGVGRSTFFNYFDSKADLLWAGLDPVIDALERRLTGDGPWPDTLRDAEDAAAAVLEPAGIPLAIALGAVMGVDDSVQAAGDRRRDRAATAMAAFLEPRLGPPAARLRARVIAGAHVAMLLAAIGDWAEQGWRRGDLRESLAAARTALGDASDRPLDRDAEAAARHADER